jgi:dTDP-4-dehydrorhamnose 3,5-epimerase
MAENSVAVDKDIEHSELEISGLHLFRSKQRTDRRGFVQAVYNGALMTSLDFDLRQENHCWSEKRGTVRGFHYQLPPFGQSKLIRITRGRILDVNVDLRKGSPTFGQHAKAELVPNGWNQIFVPVGFAHCYQTLEDDTEVIFKLGAPFAPDYARGLAWNDSDLGIEWPIGESAVTVLQRDLDRPHFSDVQEYFDYRSA